MVYDHPVLIRSSDSGLNAFFPTLGFLAAAQIKILSATKTERIKRGNCLNQNYGVIVTGSLRITS